MKTHANKVALVTGAAGGVGQALAVGLAEAGADLVLVGRNKPMDETVEMVKKAGCRAFTLMGDVGKEDDCLRFAREAVTQYGRIDILVNNAGIFPFADIMDVSYALWKEVLNTNLDAAFLMSKAVLPSMMKNKWGRIINITSNTLSLTIPGKGHYMASKMGLIGFSRGLACDVADYNITVNCVGPSLTMTPGTKSIIEETDELAKIVAMQVIKRPAIVDDYVGITNFLTSEAASFITAQNYMIDGGLTRYA